MVCATRYVLTMALVASAVAFGSLDRLTFVRSSGVREKADPSDLSRDADGSEDGAPSPRTAPPAPQSTQQGDRDVASTAGPWLLVWSTVRGGPALSWEQMTPTERALAVDAEFHAFLRDARSGSSIQVATNGARQAWILAQRDEAGATLVRTEPWSPADLKDWRQTMRKTHGKLGAIMIHRIRLEDAGIQELLEQLASSVPRKNGDPVVRVVASADGDWHGVPPFNFNLRNVSLLDVFMYVRDVYDLRISVGRDAIRLCPPAKADEP